MTAPPFVSHLYRRRKSESVSHFLSKSGRPIGRPRCVNLVRNTPVDHLACRLAAAGTGVAQVLLLEGDAAEILPTLTEPFDLIFMDAAKGQYIHFMPDILRLLKIGGTLVSDNVLQDGDIIESHYAVIRRNRTIYKRMREYLYELTHRKDLVTAVLPVGDGITVSTKVEVENDEKE